MPVGAIAGAGVIGAGASIYGANKAAGAADKGAKASIAEQRRQYDTNNQLLAPVRWSGYGALAKLNDIYGIERYPGDQGAPKPAPTGAVGSWVGGGVLPQPAGKSTTGTALQMPNVGPVDRYGGFMTSPGYQFRLDQGSKLVQGSAAARGGLFSGRTGKALTQFGQGVASEEWNQYLAGLRSLAGIGQTGISDTVAAGTNAANNISNAYQTAGMARASAYQSGAEGVSNAIQGGLSDWVYGKARGVW